MRSLVAVLLCIAIPMMAFAGDNSYKVTYDGGSLPDAKAGTGMKLYIDAGQVRLVGDKGDVITIPASSITEISYGQDVHRRVGAAIGLAVISLGIGALMALTKSKKHYVGQKGRPESCRSRLPRAGLFTTTCAGWAEAEGGDGGGGGGGVGVEVIGRGGEGAVGRGGGYRRFQETCG